MRTLKSEIDLRKSARMQRALAPPAQAQGWPSLGLGASDQKSLPREGAPRRRSRTGALLLVCLSLLVLFAVMGITFIMVAGQYRRGSVGEGKHERYGDDYKKLLDSALSQVVRDTANTNSSLIGHGLLTDMYGTDIITGNLIDPPPTLSEQILPMPEHIPGQMLRLTVANCTNLNPTSGYYNGLLMTMLEGPAAMRTTRIVGYMPASASQATFLVMAFADGRVPQDGNRLIINGRPFSGTGFGFNENDGKLTAKDNLFGVDIPLALFPNKRFTAQQESTFAATTPNNTSPSRFPNEDYDAPDYQNMALAYVPAQVNSHTDIIPSFHRPDLNYFFQNNSTWSSIWGDASMGPELRRRLNLRPLQNDHPNFTGSNPGFDEVNGPWDIDNDLDGISDSVWIDLGYPVQMSSDGRQFKPLFAILCVDLDGKLNVNAHGNIAQTDSTTYTQPITGAFADKTSSHTLPRGMGFGPADINLNVLYPDPTTSDAWYLRLLCGQAGRYPGRYGEFSLLASGYPAPGVTNAEEPLSYFKQYDFPSPTMPNRLSSFSSPVDLWGRGAIALDLHGTPMTMNMGLNGETVDDPYEIDLSRDAVRVEGKDFPYTAAELERLLRKYDADSATLPDRLRYFLSAGISGHNRMITTDSFDLPVASTLPNREIRADVANGGNTAMTIIDLINSRVDASIRPLSPNALGQLLSFELLNGKRMNVNRPLGNGRDDTNSGDPGTGIVDEPGEVNGSGGKKFFVDEALSISNVLTPNFDDINFDADNDGIVTAGSDVRAQQLLAKHIYVLLMLSKPNGTEIDFDGDPSNNSPVETAYGLAQWAVNAVDFRDRDSIMTPFEFDIRPFTDDVGADGLTWEVDGIIDDGTGTLSTDDANNYYPSNTGHRGLVWGCERPELLISESVAFHDRRTEDINGSTGRTTDDRPDPDPDGETDQDTGGKNDFDQRIRPYPAFFLELYNPWRTTASTISGTDELVSTEAPGEFYNLDENTGATQGVLLSRVAPGNSPVWRIAVAKGLNRNKDPDDPNVTDANQASASIERRIYFTQPPGAPVAGDYYCSAAPGAVRPGWYAVLGSTGPRNDGVSPAGRITSFAGGSNSDPPDYDTTRRILLDPSANPQVQVLNNASNPVEPAVADIKPAIAIPINRGVVDGAFEDRSVAISDPLNGYPKVDTATQPIDTSTNPEGIYTQAYDEPLDDVQATNDTDYAALMNFGTNRQFRRVLLQRLANPTLPWNAKSNPYLTIDSMSVDLTVFNGVSPNEAAIVSAPPTGYNSLDVNFDALQRGQTPTNPGTNNLWSHEQDLQNPPPAPQLASADSTHIFDYDLNHTLGYLNKNYQPAFTSSSGTNPAPINAPLDPNWYIGEPSALPFPWLTWNNRPYVSVFELLNVPKSRSSRLLSDFALGPASGSNGVYAAPATGQGHLLNFFEKSGTTPNHLHRVFDFLEVPSPFVGTDFVLDHKTYEAPSSGPAPTGTELLHPPFNLISEMRDPGKVNINTISSGEVWGGVLNGHSGPNWNAIADSRRGYSAVSLDPDWPTVFANPFRSSASGELTSSIDALLPPISTPPARPVRQDIDVTFLRPSDPGTGSGNPLFDFTSAAPHQDSSRNPYFRFQELSRISNLLTTRSNVYAIWITVGYFEVQPVAVDAIHPDGYQLSQELGADTGEINRHRAFYIYDRTIPVGFDRGKDLNTENGLLLKRIIE